MSRSEILRKERERILNQLANNLGNRAKLLTALMDIDDEIEEMRRLEAKKEPRRLDEMTA